MTKSKYRIELEGHNDGHPYEEGLYDSLDVAREELVNFRIEYPRIRFRLIEVLEDYDDED